MEKQSVLDALAALAQETRLDAYRLLVQAGPEGLAAGEVAEALDVPSATLSFHLKELRNAGLVACEKRGRSKLYRPDFRVMNAVLRFITENCCGGAKGRS